MHIIVNNRSALLRRRDGRSTLYASDPAKGYKIPIIHVNADDPIACLAAVRLSVAYRAEFGEDFLIDLIGYRRWGHNEGDEPAFTQPLTYARIAKHPPVDALYAKQLEAEQVVTAEDVEAMRREAEQALRAEFDALSGSRQPEEEPLRESPALSSVESSVAADVPWASTTRSSRARKASPPPNRSGASQRRRERLEEQGHRLGHAESLALASILADGEPIRLRGRIPNVALSQRHWYCTT